MTSSCWLVVVGLVGYQSVDFLSMKTRKRRREYEIVEKKTRKTVRDEQHLQAGAPARGQASVVISWDH